MQVQVLLGSNLSSSERSHVVSVFTKGQKKAGLFYDVTDANCYVQNGSTHGRVFVTIKL